MHCAVARQPDKSKLHVGEVSRETEDVLIPLRKVNVESPRIHPFLHLIMVRDG